MSPLPFFTPELVVIGICICVLIITCVFYHYHHRQVSNTPMWQKEGMNGREYVKYIKAKIEELQYNPIVEDKQTLLELSKLMVKEETLNTETALKRKMLHEMSIRYGEKVAREYSKEMNKHVQEINK